MVTEQPGETFIVTGLISILPFFFFCCPFAVHSLLKSAFNTVAIEKEKIKQILSDQEQSDQSAQINSLRKSLSQVMSRF